MEASRTIATIKHYWMLSFHNG